MLDYIIVGQGIAGSLLSWFLIKEGKQVLVIDDFSRASATRVASGISNPITGRRLVKTWLAEQLLPFAETTYREFEQIFSRPLLQPVSILRIFDSIKSQNDWSVRCSSPGYESYLHNGQIICLDKEKVNNDFGCFEINGGSRLDTSAFLDGYKNYLHSKKMLVEQNFSFSELKIENGRVGYGQLQARKIIFCEGANALANPYFKFLPFRLAKGECLLLEIEDFYEDRIITGECFIMPTVAKNEYYVGATHDWHFTDSLPSASGKRELLANLSALLKAPFKITGHKAAIRPTVKDRRPFLGFHPEYPQAGIFNGMGTKGISLAPYFARHFVDHLVRQKPLMEEVDIKRFLS